MLPPIDGARHHSRSSYYESISPPPAIQERDEQRSSSITPNSGSAGKTTPTSPTTKVVVMSGSTGHQAAQASSTSKSGFTGSELGSPPPTALPPFYSPEGSMIQPVQSGPYLDPPAEFSSQNASSPTSRQAAAVSPVAGKPHPPVNGDIRYQQVEVTATAVPEQHVRQEKETSPFDIDQPLVLGNSNGNNNNPNCRVVPVLTEGCSPSSRGLQKTDRNFPSRSSILTHSDNAEIRSSMESGFDADNELENTTAWYLSPDSSPKQDTKNPRPKLGPQVEVIIGSPVLQQNKGPPSTHSSTNSTNAQLTHFQQYSGTASDMHSLGSQSQRSRESSISEYDRLQHDRARQQKAVPPLHEDQPYYNNVGQRRGSVPDEIVIGQPEGISEPVYSEVYPVSHKASRSFDCADILNERLQSGGSGPAIVRTAPATRAARFISPPMPQHTAMTSKVARNHVVLFNGHSPTPGAPLSPVTLTNTAPSTSYQRTVPGHVVVKTKPYDHLEMGGGASGRGDGQSHSRSCSQPEEMVTVHVVTQPSPPVPQPSYANTTQLPARSQQHTYHHHHHHYYRKDRSSSGSSGRNGHRRYHQEQSTLFKSSYPGHATKSHHRNGGKSHRGSNGRNIVGHPSQLQTFTAAVVTDSQTTSDRTPPQYAMNEGSQESYSGQGTTPEATPTPSSRQPWTSGNDSGFDSMKRDERQCPVVGASAHNHFRSGACVSIIWHPWTCK